jgi:hypothetical protein
MRLRKVDSLFIAVAVAVVVGVSLLPTPKDRNPMIPKNAEHQSLLNEKDCLQCHQTGGVKPVPVRHPKRPDCFRCHARST